MSRALPFAALVGLLAGLPACSNADEAPPGPSLGTVEEQVTRLYAVIDEQAARTEGTESEVTLQHLLVAVAGGGVEGAERSPSEAEELAAELYARAMAGEDFDLLVKNYTNEVHPGIYTLTAGPSDPPRAYARDEMVTGLGDVAWRLQVGELGISPYDGGLLGAKKSPLGFHLVKRLK